MRFVLEISRGVSAAVKKAAYTVASSVRASYGWFGGTLESFSGAWQRNIVADDTESILAFSAVYSCITLIADDIAKLRIKLMQFTQGVWVETTSAAFSPVLRKPNNYQTRIQFLSLWITSKLISGNTFVLKERDARKVVVGLHILDYRRVTVLITTDGEVYYQLQRDDLAYVTTAVTIPATEIIHDRAICLFHPLIGVGPLFAAAMSATQGKRIQTNSAKFFENMSRPSGQLTAPDTIDDVTAARLKAEFEANFSGANIGRLLVSGDGLKYEPMTIPAEQAQLIEQQRWTVEDVARCFHIPLHKIGAGQNVKFSNMGELNQDYYSQTLQKLIEDIELLLDEGLGLAGDGAQSMGVELDLEGLLRMDPVRRAERNKLSMDAGYMSPDEARASENLPPVPDGAGEEPYMQQQKFPLSVLAQQPVPGASPVVEPAPQPEPPADGGAVRSIVASIEALADSIAEVNAAQKDAPKQDDAVAALACELRSELESMRKSIESMPVPDEILQRIEERLAQPVSPLEEEVPDLVKALADDLIARFSGAEYAG